MRVIFMQNSNKDKRVIFYIHDFTFKESFLNFDKILLRLLFNNMKVVYLTLSCIKTDEFDHQNLFIKKQNSKLLQYILWINDPYSSSTISIFFVSSVLWWFLFR